LDPFGDVFFSGRDGVFCRGFSQKRVVERGFWMVNSWWIAGGSWWVDGRFRGVEILQGLQIYFG
jgi:hypothetical protein